MKYRPEIDGLRALAVLPVIFFHAGFETFRGGFVGVDIFFVISGYLITSIILSKSEQGTFSLADFYERRARRILPALFLVALACMPFAWLWLLPNDMESFSRSLMAVPAFASNVLFWREVGYFDIGAELKPLLHTWSLAVEEQYYLAFPLILGLLWKFGKPWIFGALVVIGLVSLGLAQWGAYNKPAATFFLLPTRVWELMIGACVAFHGFRWRAHSDLIARNKPVAEASGLIGVLLIVFAILVFDKYTPFPSAYALVPTLGAALIILFATRETIVGRMLSARALVSVGLISYSAYLWHQPLFAFARHRSLAEPDTWVMLLLSAAAIALAYMSWKYVERPFRRADQVGKSKLLVSVSAVGIGIVIAGVFGLLSKGYAERTHLAPLKPFIEVIRQMHGQDDNWRKIGANPSTAGGSRIGNTTRIPEFAIVGDSHAATLVRSLDHASRREDISGITYTGSGCPPIRESKSTRRTGSEGLCDVFRSDFFSKLQSSEIPPIIILSSRWTILLEQTPFNNREGGIEIGDRTDWRSRYSDTMGYKTALRKDIADSILAILDSGRTVVLVYPIPEMGWNVPVRLAKIQMRRGHLESSDASTSHKVYRERNLDANRVLDDIQHHNLHRIRPEKVFCDSFVKDRCAAHLNGMPFYFDDDHLSEYGADRIVGQIIDKSKCILHQCF